MSNDDLAIYKQKRDFTKTTEPEGSSATQGGFCYVFQKHLASHLHYDFRLEFNGVLKSWAVAKGPALSPNIKRLAIEVEDHPVEYKDFEGTIPEDEYGGGTVMIWDQGTWEPEGDATEQLLNGHLSFELHGKRLKGKWSLVRIKKPQNKGKPAWLLIKKKDAFAQNDDEDRLLQEETTSVVSGRSLEKIAEEEGGGKKIGEKKATKKASTPSPPEKKKKPHVPESEESKSAHKTSKSASTVVKGVEISHPDRVVYPKIGLSKFDVAEYYAQISADIMPYLENRLLSVIRCPEGIGSGCFWERHEKITTGFLHEFEVTHNNKSLTYSYITEEKGLLHLIQFGALELHVWGSKIEAINKPDNIVFDLDPSPETSWEKVLEGAREIHSSLKKLDLEAFVRLTGGKGLHVVIPIKPQLEWEPIKAFARAFAENTAKKMPELFVAQAAKAKREGKIFIDYLRNDLTATAITTFSTRANEGATVAVPLGWQELESTLEPATFTIPEVLMRIRKQKSNPWKSFFSVTQTLSKALLKEFNVS